MRTPGLLVRQRHEDESVEAAGPQQRRIHTVRPVGGGKHRHAAAVLWRVGVGVGVHVGVRIKELGEGCSGCCEGW